MKYKIPLLYKKLMLLAVVFGPIVWLMFTDDGQRRTDTMVLWLFGEEEIKMDLAALDGRFTEEELKTVYPDLDWQCGSHQSSYGNAICASRIGVFNGIPSRYISFFFNGTQITAMKLSYRAPNHDQFMMQLQRQFGHAGGAPRVSAAPPDPAQVLEWRTPNGTLVAKQKLEEGEEPALFWLSEGLTN
jgi:hypothetical protein